MINGKKVLALIPARGGSKGLPGKNIRPCNGKPLLAWSILSAKMSRFIDRLVLSSDDPAIIRIAQEYGCEVPFLRPAHFANDNATTSDVIIHALDQLSGFDYVVLLQPTSPLRTTQDIDNCIHMCEKKKAPACVSVVVAEENPYWMYFMRNEKLMPVIAPEQPCLRRQDLPIAYNLNGAVYVAETRAFGQTKSFLTEATIGYCMPKERSIDIDDEVDFNMAEMFLMRSQRVYENV